MKNVQSQTGCGVWERINLDRLRGIIYMMETKEKVD